MISHPEVALVGSQLRLIDPSGKPTGEILHYPLAHDEIVSSLLSFNPIGHPSVLFRRSAVLLAGNYDPEAILEDYDLWLRLAQSQKMANLQDSFVDYRIRPESYTRRTERDFGMESVLISTVSKQAPGLFGLTTQEAVRLRSRQSSLAIGSAVKIARHLAATQGGSTWSRLRSSSFIGSMRALTRSRDVLSRFCFAVLDQSKGSISRELRSILAQWLTKVPFGDRVIAWARSWRKRRAFSTS